jgi:hypothetical protein
MRGSRWLAVAIVVGCVSSAGVAIAGSGSSDTSKVSGTFHADLVKKPKQRACDAMHVRIRTRFEGTQESSDDRLAGRFEADVESVVNTNNGWGRTSGTVVIRDKHSHRTKFRGKFIGVVEPDGGAEGFLTGDTKGGKHSASLLANFNVDQSIYTSAISGEFGQDSQLSSPYSPEDQDPAILTNACFDHGHHGGGGHH